MHSYFNNKTTAATSLQVKDIFGANNTGEGGTRGKQIPSNFAALKFNFFKAEESTVFLFVFCEMAKKRGKT